MLMLLLAATPHTLSAPQPTCRCAAPDGSPYLKVVTHFKNLGEGGPQGPLVEQLHDLRPEELHKFIHIHTQLGFCSHSADLPCSFLYLPANTLDLIMTPKSMLTNSCTTIVQTAGLLHPIYTVWPGPSLRRSTLIHQPLHCLERLRVASWQNSHAKDQTSAKWLAWTAGK